MTARPSLRMLLADERGFTLLEVIIAMTIMVLAFAAILSVESGGITAAEKTRQLNVVSMLARNKMIEMEYEIEGKTFEEVKKEDGGQFETPFEDFRWTSEVKELKFPNLNLANAGSTPDQAAPKDGVQPVNDLVSLLTKLMTNFLSKSIREVTVAVYWKRPSGEQRFNVSMYWVDLNHEFELTPN